MALPFLYSVCQLGFEHLVCLYRQAQGKVTELASKPAGGESKQPPPATAPLSSALVDEAKAGAVASQTVREQSPAKGGDMCVCICLPLW
jgi:hypothetical protein